MDKSLLDDLSKKGIFPTPVRPGGFGITIREYMNIQKCSEPVARKTLSKAVNAGILVSHPMRFGVGTAPLIFCRPGEWPPK